MQEYETIDEAKHAASQYDNLSREQLIDTINKQTILLQIAKEQLKYTRDYIQSFTSETPSRSHYEY